MDYAKTNARKQTWARKRKKKMSEKKEKLKEIERKMKENERK